VGLWPKPQNNKLPRQGSRQRLPSDNAAAGILAAGLGVTGMVTCQFMRGA